jgi:hypothetical protein
MITCGLLALTAIIVVTVLICTPALEPDVMKHKRAHDNGNCNRKTSSLSAGQDLREHEAEEIIIEKEAQQEVNGNSDLLRKNINKKTSFL